MTHAPEHEMADEIFVNLAMTIGPKFYGDKKHGTNEEIAEVLSSYAAHYDGVLREVFVILEKYYRTQVGLPLHPLAEAPDPNVANATGSTNATVGTCGGCTTSTGKKGYWVYSSGKKQSCIAC